jgi:hypothetical protein
MNQTPLDPANHAGPDDPPQQEPTHDVPVYPEHDPPPDRKVDVGALGGETDQPVQGEEPDGGQEEVDEDDLDPRVPHSPPDANRGKILFDENGMAG